MHNLYKDEYKWKHKAEWSLTILFVFNTQNRTDAINIAQVKQTIKRAVFEAANYDKLP